MAKQRTQFFLDDDQYEAVAQLAQDQERPIPELLRDLVDLALDRVKEQTRERRAALHGLSALRRSIEARSGIYPGDPVGEARMERERQRAAVFSPAEKK